MLLIGCRPFYCYFCIANILSNLIVCKFFNDYFFYALRHIFFLFFLQYLFKLI